MISGIPSNGAASSSGYQVSPAEAEIIGFFVHAAAALGIPKSIGELFGLLYCSEEALSFEDIVTRLGISKGSASQGLRFLQGLGAVHLVLKARDRRTFYRAEISMRRLLASFLESRVAPRLQHGEESLDQLVATLDQAPESPVLASAAILRQRLDGLRHWHFLARKFLPLVSRLTSRSL